MSYPMTIFTKIKSTTSQFLGYLYKLDIVSEEGDGRISRFKSISKRILIFTTLFYVLILFFGPKRYSARYLYNLPGDKSNASLSLAEIGTSSRDIGTAGYASSTYDPRENYKAIFLSDPVVSEAKRLSRTKRFPLPKIIIKPNSTIISVIFTTSNFEKSLKYANSFNTAAINRISELRKISIAERRQPIDELISDITSRLNISQRALSDFQSKNKLKSEKQIDDIIDIVTELKQEESKLEASIEKNNTELAHMLTTLDLTYGQVGQTLKLRNDKTLEEMLEKYAEITTKVKVNSSIYGINHPEQKMSLEKFKTLSKTLVERAKKVTGKTLDLREVQRLALMETRQLDNSLLLIDLIKKEVSLRGFISER